MRAGRRLPFARGLALAVLAMAWLGACAFAYLAIAGVAAQRQTVRDAREMLSRLEARVMAGGPGAVLPGGSPAADPFLAGDSVNVAAADLQERVVAAIRRAGGNVTSSQVDLTDTKSVPRRLALAATCELAQAALQRLLYDLEAGAPYLYLDQVVIQTGQDLAGSASITASSDAGLRVTLSVSAYWRGGKS